MVTKTLVADRGSAVEAAAALEAPISPEELADRIVPSDPQIAPDGSRVAFVAAPVGKKEEHRARDLAWGTWPNGPTTYFGRRQ